MPKRIIRDWTGSEKVNTLSANAERFLIRLMMKADDFGCYHADNRILRATLFPLIIDKVKESLIQTWKDECIAAGLLHEYACMSNIYLEINEFGQRLDRAIRKYPTPGQPQDINENPHVLQSADNHSCGNVPVSSGNFRAERKGKERKGKEGESGKDPGAQPTPDDISFKKFNEFLETDAFDITRMREPFTLEQYLSIRKRYSVAYIADLCKKMHNWAPLLKKNKSAYLTFTNWSRRDHNSPAEIKNSNLANSVKAMQNHLSL